MFKLSISTKYTYIVLKSIGNGKLNSNSKSSLESLDKLFFITF